VKLFGDLRCPRCGGTNVSPHMTPLMPQGEADVWVPVRDESYQCSDCRLLETRLNNADDYEEFRRRWNDPIKVMSPAELQASSEELQRLYEERDRSWTWPSEDLVTDREQRVAKLVEERRHSDYMIWASQQQGWKLPEYKYGFPVGEEFIASVVQNPDADAPRWEYARWLRTHDTDVARRSAEFVEWQLRLAESLRADPQADIRPQLPDGVFFRRWSEPTDLPDQSWWRYPGIDCKYSAPGAGEKGLGESTKILDHEGIIDNSQFFRGFIEHVAIRAARFLEIADELYGLAPIRHLTLTYCKGLDHQDAGLWKALLESPHLDRIRSLRIPVRAFGMDNEYTELNRLADEDLELLAASSHLRGLAYLDLEDQERLTVRGFDALAASPNLPALSFVRHDINRYGRAASFTFGDFGKDVRELLDRPLARYAPEIEARHGRIVWLHPVESYGTETPDLEAVVEHPVAVLGGSGRES
jgi:hypothetical protein